MRELRQLISTFLIVAVQALLVAIIVTTFSSVPFSRAWYVSVCGIFLFLFIKNQLKD